MINPYSCCTYVNKWANLIGLDSLCKQINLTLVIYSRDNGDFKGEKYAGVAYLCGYYIVVLFTVFQILFSTYKPDWFLNLLFSLYSAPN